MGNGNGKRSEEPEAWKKKEEPEETDLKKRMRGTGRKRKASVGWMCIGMEELAEQISQVVKISERRKKPDCLEIVISWV